MDRERDIYVAGEFQNIAAFDGLSLTNTNPGQGDVFVARINGGPPKLGIRRLPNQVQVTWPASTLGYHLETITNLLLAQWQTVTNVPVINETNTAVTLTNVGSKSFFRLKNP